MEKSLPIILSELRKAKGISQKEAASQLGISQALLSHYEKGIRECGLGFLVKAADFYGVSCDYLLGRSNSPSGLNNPQVSSNKNEETDSLPIAKTFIKATALLKDFIHQKDSTIGTKFDTAFALQLYQIAVMQAAAGNIPKSWVGKAFSDEKLFNNPVYMSLISSAAERILSPYQSENACDETPVPDAIKTIVDFAEERIFKEMKENIPFE